MSAVASEIIRAIEANGGRIRADGDTLVITPKAAAASVADDLRQHKAELLAELTRRDEARMDDLRPVFIRWFDSQVWLDTVAIATHANPTWMTAVSSLHADCGAWMSVHATVVPPVAGEFRQLLAELGCDVRLIHGEELVCYVALESDREAQIEFAVAEPAPNPAPVYGTYSPAPAVVTPGYKVVRQDIEIGRGALVVMRKFIRTRRK
jgi:hypothetical protein